MVLHNKSQFDMLENNDRKQLIVISKSYTTYQTAESVM